MLTVRPQDRVGRQPQRLSGPGRAGRHPGRQQRRPGGLPDRHLPEGRDRFHDERVSPGIRPHPDYRLQAEASPGPEYLAESQTLVFPLLEHELNAGQDAGISQRPATMGLLEDRGALSLIKIECCPQAGWFLAAAMPHRQYIAVIASQSVERRQQSGLASVISSGDQDQSGPWQPDLRAAETPEVLQLHMTGKHAASFAPGASSVCQITLRRHSSSAA
jgi:hypothetical protein